jgi:hypothetical protein
MSVGDRVVFRWSLQAPWAGFATVLAIADGWAELQCGRLRWWWPVDRMERIGR